MADEKDKPIAGLKKAFAGLIAPAGDASEQAPKPEKRKAGKDASGASKAKGGAASAASSRATRRQRRRASATQHSELGEKLIAGVPARIMRPRLTFIACLAAICLFGLLMVYSASSVEALKEQGSPYYFLIRQGIFMSIGVVAILVLSGRFISFPQWRHFRSLAPLAWGAIMVLLVVVLIIGTGGEEWGARRWIALGFFNLQPAEFAKPAIILMLASVLASYYEDTTISTGAFLVLAAAVVGLPLGLIVVEPDLGTTLIIAVTAFVMLYTCGLSYRLVGMSALVAVVGIVVFIAIEPYRITRFFSSLDPWSDPFDNGYQATLSIMAFASGGLFGRGIGNATMKYHYLPEAHNDYILAIIGEELGFVGTIIFVGVFLLMLYAGMKIALRAPSLHAQLVATGCTFVLAAQFFVNCLGILGLIPMTGKPLPFVSYGGSSVLTSMILAGIILRVSLESNVATTADRRRAGLAVMGAPADAGEEGESGYVGRSTAGSVRTRSERRSSSRGAKAARSRGFDVVDGGRMDSPAPTRRTRDAGRREGGYERIDLNAGGSDRLRRDGLRTRVDYHDVVATPRPRRSGDDRRGSSNRNGRGRHDR